MWYTDPYFISACSAIVGVLARAYCPWIIPFISPTEKALKEMAEKYEKSD